MSQTSTKSKGETVKLRSKQHNPFLQNKDHKKQLNLKQNLIQRFAYKYQQNSELRSSKLTKREVQNDIQVNLQSSREYLWITDKGRQLFQTKSEWKKHVGPGKYPFICPTERHHSNWPKTKRFNYQKSEMVTQVGPGLYQTDKNERVKQRIGGSSVFKSKTTKSYLADKINEFRKNQQIYLNPQAQFKPTESQICFQNENHYQRIQSQKKMNGSPVFVSKCVRLPSIPSSSVGPGSYIIQQVRSKSPEVIKRIVAEPKAYVSKENLMNRESLQRRTTEGSEICIKNEMQQKKRKTLLGVMMKERRFKQMRTQCPGPGHYQLITNIAKKQKGLGITQSQEKLKGAGRSVASLIKKAFNRNRLNTKSQSQISVFKLFRNFQKEREVLQDFSHQK